MKCVVCLTFYSHWYISCMELISKKSVKYRFSSKFPKCSIICVQIYSMSDIAVISQKLLSNKEKEWHSRYFHFSVNTLCQITLIPLKTILSFNTLLHLPHTSAFSSILPYKSRRRWCWKYENFLILKFGVWGSITNIIFISVTK